MVKCCAPLCGNASYRKLPDITFHRFPKDVSLKNAWLAKLGRKNWKPNPSIVLCSNHFEAHLVDHSGFRSVLAPGAVPTIFDLSLKEEHELPRPARGETIKQESQNLQPSTSDATLCYNILTPSTKGLVKTTASRDHNLQELQNLQPNISDATRTHILETIDPQNRTQYCCSSARDLSRLKAKLILKNKTLKALREKTRRFKKKVSKFSNIITELKRKLQDRDLSLEKHTCK